MNKQPNGIAKLFETAWGKTYEAYYYEGYYIATCGTGENYAMRIFDKNYNHLHTCAIDTLHVGKLAIEDLFLGDCD